MPFELGFCQTLFGRRTTPAVCQCINMGEIGVFAFGGDFQRQEQLAEAGFIYAL